MQLVNYQIVTPLHLLQQCHHHCTVSASKVFLEMHPDPRHKPGLLTLQQDPERFIQTVSLAAVCDSPWPQYNQAEY